MLSVKAKQDWVPFGNPIKMRDVKKDIDFNLIECKVPLRITDAIGIYINMQYQFTEQSFKKLSYAFLVAYNDRVQDRLFQEGEDGDAMDDGYEHEDSHNDSDCNLYKNSLKNHFSLNKFSSQSKHQSIFLSKSNLNITLH